MKAASNGLPLVLGAYLFWGMYPVYLKALGGVAPFEIMAHRVIWAALAMLLVMWVSGRFHLIGRALRDCRTLGVCAACAVLLSANWIVYAGAVSAGHLGEASLGNFINPLLSIWLGAWLFKEPLTRWQSVAIGLAALGVVAQVVLSGAVPWLGLFLAASFALYGAMRKIVAIGAFEALVLETLLLTPMAVAYLGWLFAAGAMRFGSADPSGHAVDALLVSLGPISSVPLALFAIGAKRIRLTTLGLVQFVSPCAQFALAFFWYGEPLARKQLLPFGIIWCAVAIYAMQVGKARRVDAAAKAVP